MNTINTIKSILLAGLLMMAMPLMAQQQQRKSSELDVQLRKLIYAQGAIVQLYVDTVNVTKLTEDAIQGMLKGLDPHSIYTPAKDVEAMNEPLTGSFDGIGVQFNMNEDTLVVIQTISGGPSEKVGIMAGDMIVSVNDTAIAGVKMSREAIMKRLRGPKGTTVDLGVIRPGVNGVQLFKVTRDKIPVYTVDACYMLDDKTGYVRISNFGSTTTKEFVTATNYLTACGMKDLILDLQGNPGGYLQAAVDLSDQFLNNNEMIVYTEGRTTGRQEYRAGKNKIDLNKIVVLVDGYTASAAEIVSGALQDHDRGIIVGRRTFAKGLVQRSIPLPDGAEMRLTIAHYYSPVGRCFQKPYEKGDRSKYDRDMLDRLNSGELMSADSIHFPDSLKYTTKGGRIVYGGGGIMPDVYVPLDTTYYTRLHRELAAKGCINSSILKWININQKRLSKDYNVSSFRKERERLLKDKDVNNERFREGFQRFKNEFQVPQEMLDMLFAKAKEAQIEYTDSAYQATLPFLCIQLKALVARDLFSSSEYYEIINPISEIYKEGLKAIKDEELFKDIKTQ